MYRPNVHRGPATSEKAGGREQRKYGVVELFLLEQKAQAVSWWCLQEALGEGCWVWAAEPGSRSRAWWYPSGCCPPKAGPWRSIGLKLRPHVGQLALLGAGQMFLTYLRSYSHLKLRRWGQLLMKQPKTFQSYGSPPTEHNRGMALHPEWPCGEIYVNTLPPAGHGWDSHRLGSGLPWVLLAIGGHQSPGPRPTY